MRLQYPTNVRIIRTPCTGRLEVEYFLKAFEKGADGVLIAGCEEGSCHFIEGNFLAKRRVNYTQKLLSEAGFESRRLRMVNLGAADPGIFVDLVKDMIETVRELGPNPLNQADTSPGAIPEEMIEQEIQA